MYNSNSKINIICTPFCMYKCNWQPLNNHNLWNLGKGKTHFKNIWILF